MTSANSTERLGITPDDSNLDRAVEALEDLDDATALYRRTGDRRILLKMTQLSNEAHLALERVLS